MLSSELNKDLIDYLNVIDIKSINLDYSNIIDIKSINSIFIRRRASY